jgi:acetyltransferase-like isoleucine patch superfamily enzyme
MVKKDPDQAPGETHQYDTDTGTTRLQGSLSDASTSSLVKYQTINTGTDSLLFLLAYELYTMLLAPLPGAVGYLLRKWVLKRMLADCGTGLIVGRNVTIRHPGKIRLGDNIAIDDYAVLDAKGKENQGISIGDNVMLGRGAVLSCKDGNISIGGNTNIAMGCIIQSGRQVSIGEKVLFGAYCYVVGGGDHRSTRVDIPIMDQGQTIKGITIGDHCWLGADVKVIDGVDIGRDAVLGAGAVVTRDVPDYAVAAGVPAEVLRDRRDSAPKTDPHIDRDPE